MDSYTWTHLCWLTSKNLHSLALCEHWMLSSELTKRNGQCRWTAKESVLSASVDDGKFVTQVSETHFVDNIFKRVRAHFFPSLNGFKHCYVTLIILLIITHLFAHS